MLPFAYSMRNLARRPLRTSLTVAGIAVATALIVMMTAFAAGLVGTLRHAANPLNVMLLSLGAEQDPVRSAVDRRQAEVAAASMPGIREDASGRYVSIEVMQMMNVGTTRDQVEPPLVMVRGVSAGAWLVHDRVHVIDGREPRGDNELIVGALASSRLGVPASRLDIGQKLWIENTEWTITGHFVAPGTPLESELWVPLNDLMVATRRTDVTLVAATLRDQAGMDNAMLYIDERVVDLQLLFVTEQAWYASLLRLIDPIAAIAQALALLVLVGGVIGCANTLYASSLARTGELAALQILGYTRLEVVTGLIVEGLLLTGMAGMIGLSLATAIGAVPLKIPMGAFAFRASGSDLLIGLAAAGTIGLVGALFPAWRLMQTEAAAARAM
ncbi:MAG: ABC transporter permease [Planctomycetota bacterium]